MQMMCECVRVGNVNGMRRLFRSIYGFFSRFTRKFQICSAHTYTIQQQQQKTNQNYYVYPNRQESEKKLFFPQT